VPADLSIESAIIFRCDDDGLFFRHVFSFL